MARIRSINPTAATDEDVATMPMMARLVWAYLPCHADREGRMRDSAFTLRAAITPNESVAEMEEALVELAARRHIIRYEVAGRRFIQIRSFARHQSPHTRETPSAIPAPPDKGNAEPSKGSAQPDIGGKDFRLTASSPSIPDPDPSPVLLSPVSEQSGSDAGARKSGGRATEPLSGYVLRQIFSAVRSEIVGGMPWQSPHVADGKDSTMAEIVNSDPAARADVRPTMEMLFRDAKAGKHQRAKEIIEKPAFAFGVWCSDWTPLRERLHGSGPAKVAARGGYGKL